MTSADSCRMGGIEDVGMVGLEYVSRLLRMGAILCNACVWICWRWGTFMGVEWSTYDVQGFPRAAKFLLSYCDKIGLWKPWTGESRGCADDVS